MARLQMRPMPARLGITLDRRLARRRRIGALVALLVVVAAVTVSLTVVRSGLLAGSGRVGFEAGSLAAGTASAGVESVVVLDWDAGSADWEHISDDTMVGEIQLRDPATLDTIATIPTGYDPQIALSRGGSRLALAETVSVNLKPVQRLRVFDLSDGVVEIAAVPLEDRVLTTGDVAPGVVAASDDGSQVFVEGYLANSYWIDAYDIDSGGSIASRVELPDYCGIAAISPVPESSMFVAACKGPSATVTIVDALAGTSTTLQLSGAPEFINGIPAGGSGRETAAAALAADGSLAYVLARNGMLHVIDIIGDSVVDVQQLDTGGRTVSPDQLESSIGALYVGLGVSDEVSGGRSSSIGIFRADDFGLDRVIDSPISISSFTVSPDGTRVYMLDRRSRQLAVLDGGTGKQVELIADVGHVPDYISLR